MLQLNLHPLEESYDLIRKLEKKVKEITDEQKRNEIIAQIREGIDNVLREHIPDMPASHIDVKKVPDVKEFASAKAGNSPGEKTHALFKYIYGRLRIARNRIPEVEREKIILSINTAIADVIKEINTTSFKGPEVDISPTRPKAKENVKNKITPLSLTEIQTLLSKRIDKIFANNKPLGTLAIKITNHIPFQNEKKFKTVADLVEIVRQLNGKFRLEMNPGVKNVRGIQQRKLDKIKDYLKELGIPFERDLTEAEIKMIRD